jgi:phage terminase large subunit GpA-like protein
MSVPDWADDFRYIAKTEGGGKWSTATAEIARGPMLAVTEPGVHTITAMAATQLLKTSLLLNTFGYFAHLDPCPILLVQPKQSAAEDFSKERITPTIAATPVLRGLVGTRKSRSSDESIAVKPFPGGFLAIVGAGSATNLSSRPIRIMLFDEVDKYEVGREGDPIAIGEERTARFGGNWLSIRCCSPTVDEESRIAASWAESDQRRASVECPHCGHRQFLDFTRHVEWDKGGGGEHLTLTARIYCEACAKGWSEGERLRALQTIRWHQTRAFVCCGKSHSPLAEYDAAWRANATAVGTGPAEVVTPRETTGLQKSPAQSNQVTQIWDWWEGPRWAVYRARCPECGSWPVPNHHAGFQASKLYSPWPKDRPSDIATKWIAAQANEDLLQVWWNTQLGLPYRRKAGIEVEPDVLLARREVYRADVPDGVAVITIGIDSQGDRIELEVVGWGYDEESWSLAYEVFDGDQESPKFWEPVRDYLTRRWLRADGVPFVAMAASIDSGGHHTQAVYNFCRDNAGLLQGGVHAIKGASERSGQRSPVWPPLRKARKARTGGFRPVMIGTNAAKDSISSRLLIAEPGPGYMHFPAWWDRSRFDQLTAERLIPKRVGGWMFRVWQPRPGRSNEALDCRVYAYAALCALMHRGMKLNAFADQAGASRNNPLVLLGTTEAERIDEDRRRAAPVPVTPPWMIQAPAGRSRGAGWLGGRRKGWL